MSTPSSIPPKPLRRPASSGPDRRDLWWRELTVGLLSGALVAAGSFYSQTLADDQRSERETTIAQGMADEADRRENLRFIRDRSHQDGSSIKPFSDMDLTGQTLRRLKLDNSDFNGATLTETYFDNASLIGGTFVDTTLTKASFAGADLSRAQIYLSPAEDSSFSKANLTEADLGFTSFTGADFRGAVLVRARVQAGMENVDLREANLTGASLQGSNFAGANFSGADLRGANLAGSVLENVTWKSVVKGQFFSPASGEVPTEVTLIPCADETTVWPESFLPPETKTDGCSTDSTQSLIESARRAIESTRLAIEQLGTAAS